MHHCTYNSARGKANAISSCSWACREVAKLLPVPSMHTITIEKAGKTLAVAMSCDDVMSQFDALLLTAIVQCSKCQGFLMDLMGSAARG